MKPRHCARCPTIGPCWQHRSLWLCDACLTRSEEAIARDLGEGEYLPPRWSPPPPRIKVRPITEQEANQRQRSWAPHSQGSNASTVIDNNIAHWDYKGGPKLSKKVNEHWVKKLDKARHHDRSVSADQALTHPGLFMACG